jgi:oligopeptide transport system ATP-binding protein
MSESILKMTNLHVSYSTFHGSVHAVRGITLELKRGQTLALVGESGCGKSATVKPIIGEDAPNQVIEAGKIEFTYQVDEGQRTVDILQLSAKEMQSTIKGKQIAMIFQDPMTSLDPTMRIGRQIGEAVVAAHPKIEHAALQAKILELIRTVGITHEEAVSRQYPHQLSGGMRQRIVIAIALAGDPSLLICDEPTTALDVTIQARILALIKKIQSERKLSVIFITHNLGVVAKVADQVAVMYAGKVIEYGTVDDIFFDPKHPYTWGLLSSVPDVTSHSAKLATISGTIPDLTKPIVGDAFAPRNPYALKIDFKKEPPMFQINAHHQARTWLLDPRAPQVKLPETLKLRIQKMKAEVQND